ncbi:MAG: hypothetical protein BJG00_001705 [Limnothrix sp. CACIAM 69d]|nr:MAG: hypothetical protein BJG00_001705 [Limnothrix sp. CACIAM 69d]
MTDILIVTSNEDIHADAVIQALASSKLNPIRLNSESFIQQSQYAYSWDQTGQLSQEHLTLLDSLREIQDLGVIWWRKPNDFQPFPEVEDPWAIKYCQQETESLIFSLPGLFPKAQWVNNYYNIRIPSHRINQIPVAKGLGILIPPTIVTNDYEAACDFVQSHQDCIVKPMRYSGFLHQDQQYGCYTRLIDLEILQGLKDSIRLAPVFIQKRIHKKSEYRVTLIGKKHFVCRIEAEGIHDQDVQLDWRVTEPDKLAHYPDALPDDYIQKLYGMLKVFGLNFGAFDIIRDDDDQLYFIELNPNGQWYWIELLTGLPMVQAMVELLEQLADRYISL